MLLEEVVCLTASVCGVTNEEIVFDVPAGAFFSPVKTEIYHKVCLVGLLVGVIFKRAKWPRTV